MLGLIDADHLAYRAAFAGQHTYYDVTITGEEGARASFPSAKERDAWLKEMGLDKSDVEVVARVEYLPLSQVAIILNHFIDNIETAIGRNHVMFIKNRGATLERNILYPDYKAGRPPSPLYLQDMYDILLSKGAAVAYPGLEADDMISIYAWGMMDEGSGDYCIVSRDKDLKTVPGLHYDFVTGEFDEVSIYDANFNFYVQLLTGDYADNVPGIYKVGQKTAEKLLYDCITEEDMYNVCKEQYEKAGVSIDIMHRNAQLLYLKKHEDDVWVPPLSTQ